MREHIRIDTIKVFEEENSILSAIMKKHNCNKSDAYRKALEAWDLVHSIQDENEALKNQQQETHEKIDDLYNKFNFLMKQ